MHQHNRTIPCVAHDRLNRALDISCFPVQGVYIPKNQRHPGCRSHCAVICPIRRPQQGGLMPACIMDSTSGILNLCCQSRLIQAGKQRMAPAMASDFTPHLICTLYGTFVISYTAPYQKECCHCMVLLQAFQQPVCIGPRTIVKCQCNHRLFRVYPYLYFRLVNAPFAEMVTFIFNKIVSCHPGAFGIQIVPPAIRQRHPSFFHLSVVSKVTVFPFYLHPPSGNHHTVFLEVIFIVSNLPPAGYFLSIRGDVIFLSFICLPSLSCEHFFPASGLLIRQAVRSLYIHPSG